MFCERNKEAPPIAISNSSQDFNLTQPRFTERVVVSQKMKELLQATVQFPRESRRNVSDGNRQQVIIINHDYAISQDFRFFLSRDINQD